MSTPYTYYNTENWGRKNAFNFYRHFDDPYFNVTVNVDVTQLKEYCKANFNSFFLASIHACLKAVNIFDNFRMRMEGDKIRLYNTIHGGSTLFYDDESFGFAYYDYDSDIKSFCDAAEPIMKEAQRLKSFNPSAEREDLIYFSSLPWLQFTSFKHAQDSNINKSIPRITFGKYYEQHIPHSLNTRLLLPINVEVNHALMDGYHVGLFFEKLQYIINETLR